MQRSLRLFQTFPPHTQVQPLLASGSIGKRYNNTRPNQRASDKLFEDAAREEAEAAERPRTPTRVPFLENEHENWTGEERIQDAVLRMLVDKYKPLRSGTIQSAEQKLKGAPPRITAGSQVIVTPVVPSTGSWATVPLLPSSKDHQPWHTEFKAPSHATASIKHATLPPVVVQPTSKLPPVDDRARRKEREERKKTEHAGRLARARESTLDYRLGIRSSGGPVGQINPVSLKGWSNLIEDKIQKARNAGLFRTVKGRGKPLVRSTEESNPFIAREEFLMNRIVQRNGAAPPWVEVQSELDTAVGTFREILQQSWIRQAIRTITTSIPPGLLHTFTLSDIKAFRDPEWEQREHSYHQAALEEINSLVRKYNGLAPYSVRRPYYDRRAEFEKLFEGCAADILQELAQRIQNTDLEIPLAGNTVHRSPSDRTPYIGNTWRIRDLFKTWLKSILWKTWSK